MLQLSNLKSVPACNSTVMTSFNLLFFRAKLSSQPLNKLEMNRDETARKNSFGSFAQPSWIRKERNTLFQISWTGLKMATQTALQVMKFSAHAFHQKMFIWSAERRTNIRILQFLKERPEHSKQGQLCIDLSLSVLAFQHEFTLFEAHKTSCCDTQDSAVYSSTTPFMLIFMFTISRSEGTNIKDVRHPQPRYPKATVARVSCLFDESFCDTFANH